MWQHKEKKRRYLSGFPSPVLKAWICIVFLWSVLLHQLTVFVKTKVSWERRFLNTNPFPDLNCLLWSEGQKKTISSISSTQYYATPDQEYFKMSRSRCKVVIPNQLPASGLTRVQFKAWKEAMIKYLKQNEEKCMQHGRKPYHV